MQVLHVLYTIFVHIATGYGLGQLYADVGDTNSYSTALMYEICSQVAGIMAIGVGKCAVGVFLLRIVVNKIQIGFLYGFLAATTFITLFASITVVIQCIPPERIWNQAAEGYCWLDFSKVGFTVGCKYSMRLPIVETASAKHYFVSLVRLGRLRVRGTALVCHLESQYEAQGKDHDCVRPQPRDFVSFMFVPFFVNVWPTNTPKRWGMWYCPHCRIRQFERI